MIASSRYALLGHIFIGERDGGVHGSGRSSMLAAVFVAKQGERVRTLRRKTENKLRTINRVTLFT